MYADLVERWFFRVCVETRFFAVGDVVQATGIGQCKYTDALMERERERDGEVEGKGESEKKMEGEREREKKRGKGRRGKRERVT